MITTMVNNMVTVSQNENLKWNVSTQTGKCVFVTVADSPKVQYTYSKCSRIKLHSIGC